MFSPEQISKAEKLLDLLRSRGLVVTSAESCTGGLIAALFTEIAGSSDVFERGFVTYSNEAKAEMLGVPCELIAQHGAVSQQVASAMATGALQNSLAKIAISVTGIAGPGGGSAEKPVGLVYLAVALEDGEVTGQTCKFGDLGRSNIRKATIDAALQLINTAIAKN